MLREKKKRRLPVEPAALEESPEASEAASRPPWWHSLIPFIVVALAVGLVVCLLTGGSVIGFLVPAALVLALVIPFHYFAEGWLAKHGWLKQGLETTVIITITLVLGFAGATEAWLLQPYTTPTGSMEPTIDIGQHILVNHLAYEFNDPSIGDIIVFHPPVGASGRQCGTVPKPGEPCPVANKEEQKSENFTKRIVAGPGDTFSIHEGHPVVNGVEKKDEPYTNPCDGPGPGICNMPRMITIPPDHYLLMGDNRGDSIDSRFWGPIPRAWIVGEVFATYWPLDRLGFF